MPSSLNVYENIIGNQNAGEKRTRWDRITKKYSKSGNAQASHLRRFVDKQCIKESVLHGMSSINQDSWNGLDPKLVMDIRHEVVRNNTVRYRNRILNLNEKTNLQLKQVRSQQQTQEQRYIKKEISNFRHSLHTKKKTNNVVKMTSSEPWRDEIDLNTEVISWKINYNEECSDEVIGGSFLPNQGTYDKDKIISSTTPLLLVGTRLNIEPTEQSETNINALHATETCRSNEMHEEQSEIIADLFYNNQKSKYEETELLRKCFLRWVHFTTIQKIEGQIHTRTDSRNHQIQQFLNHIRKEKNKQHQNKTQSMNRETPNVPKNSTDFQKITLNAKLKKQRDIIDLQKIKLQRQERMINELKISRITEGTLQSQSDVKKELHKVMHTGAANSRSIAKCLQLVGNLRDTDDPNPSEEYAALQAKGTPKFLMEMQMRARERNVRHQEARERRLQLEREKEEQRLAAEALKLKEDEEAKRKRINDLQEKRRQERLQRQQKEEERVRQLDNEHKAVVFNRRRLIRFGMSGFRAAINRKHSNLRKMEKFRVFIVLRHAIRSWHQFVVDAWLERKRLADHCKRIQLLRFGMNAWKRYQALQHSKLLVAIDWYELRLGERVFREWGRLVREQKCIEEAKMRVAEAHYNWHLKWRVIENWKRLQAILQLERETGERRQKWRLKIWELLPDYQPNAEVQPAATVTDSDTG